MAKYEQKRSNGFRGSEFHHQSGDNFCRMTYTTKKIAAIPVQIYYPGAVGFQIPVLIGGRCYNSYSSSRQTEIHSVGHNGVAIRQHHRIIESSSSFTNSNQRNNVPIHYNNANVDVTTFCRNDGGTVYYNQNDVNYSAPFYLDVPQPPLPAYYPEIPPPSPLVECQPPSQQDEMPVPTQQLLPTEYPTSATYVYNDQAESQVQYPPEGYTSYIYHPVSFPSQPYYSDPQSTQFQCSPQPYYYTSYQYPYMVQNSVPPQLVNYSIPEPEVESVSYQVPEVDLVGLQGQEFYPDNNNVDKNCVDITDGLEQMKLVDEHVGLENKCTEVSELKDSVIIHDSEQNRKELESIPASEHVELENYAEPVPRHEAVPEYAESEPVPRHKPVTGHVESVPKYAESVFRYVDLAPEYINSVSVSGYVESAPKYAESGLGNVESVSVQVNPESVPRHMQSVPEYKEPGSVSEHEESVPGYVESIPKNKKFVSKANLFPQKPRTGKMDSALQKQNLGQLDGTETRSNGYGTGQKPRNNAAQGSNQNFSHRKKKFYSSRQFVNSKWKGNWRDE